ncbi:MAG: hypothetical protein KAT66_09200 [Candidatus Lokiarchaeota archaeon]|nr:hypothetical protein [Candidatus Lokiarchaeota archaeon]
MNENQEESHESINEKEEEGDDLQAYLSEMETLKSDFSDLDDLDIEELQEMQDAIVKVKEMEELTNDKISEIIDDTKIITEIEQEKEMKESMLSDFSDIDEIDMDELREMKEAIESVKQEELVPSEEETEFKTQTIPTELEQRIKEELAKRKELEKVEIVTPEKLLNYLKEKREKIWYHALYYLVFNVEDYIASKGLLYDVLKEVTSKSPIDPIPEHQFYFGLGYLLRLSLNNKKVIRFLRDSKFKVNVNIKELTQLLEEAGEPISTRPVIKEAEKKKMFKEFLKDDFLDF